MTEANDLHERMRALWEGLSGAAKDTLIGLCRRGPLWDGDVPSKNGRDELLDKAMAAKIVLKNCEDGYQAATYLGAHVYRAGFVEPRKDAVRKAVAPELAQYVKPR